MSGRLVRTLPLLGLSAWFALLAAGLELGTRAVLKWAVGRHYDVGLDALWLTPLAHLLLGFAAGLLAMAIPRPGTAERRVAFSGAALAVLAVAWHVRSVDAVASLVLALGVATQVSRSAPRLWRCARLTAAPLAGAFLALAVFARAWPALAERHALAGLPAAPAGAPHVLLVVFDTVRAESTSLGGHVRPTTPFLEELARRGTTFELAFTTSPWTLPSIASLFTGCYPHQLSCGLTTAFPGWGQPIVTRTALDGRLPVLAEVLSARGYRTGGFAANLHYCTGEFGLDRGFSHYESYEATPDELLYHAVVLQRLAHLSWVRWACGRRKAIGFRSAESINRAFLRWLDRGEGDRPYFAFLNYMEAHDPYFQAPPYDRMFLAPGDAPPDPRLWLYHERDAHRAHPRAAEPPEVRAQIAAYEGGIRAMDDALRALCGELERRGVLDRTWLVVTSDHGEQFLEHGSFGHARSVYRVETHVPLLIVPPGGSAARRVATPVSLRDLPATMLEAAGSTGELPGRSLLRPVGPVSPVLSTLGRSARGSGVFEQHALVVGAHRGVLDVGGPLGVYALSDAAERHDLLRSPAGSRLVEPFHSQLRAALGDAD